MHPDSTLPPPAEHGPVLTLSHQWNRIALAAVLILAAVLDFVGLQREGYGNSYYAAAVKSMMQNWHAFFFNSLDPAGFVTIDKPPLGFWLQVASAKLFGFNGVALMLPQALAGVISVGVLYYLVIRLFGRTAGFVAALALALTPISVVANRNNIVDSTLVCLVLLGAWAVSRAVETGKLRWLLLCALFVGLGFNVKMLEAYLVVPAFGLMYLLAAATSLRRRLAHLVAASVVLLAISLSWATAVDLTPASARPWVGSTTTNSEIDLAIGYNGLQRLTGNSGVGGGSRPGATSGGPPGGAGGGPGGVGENGPTGALRLLNSQLGPQVGWLLPIAVLGLIVAAWETRRRRFKLEPRQAALVLWGTWLLTTGVFFSVAGFFHTYYLVMVAPAIAALAGIGIVSLWQAYRRDGSRLWFLLPAGLVGGAAVQSHLLGPYPTWSQVLEPIIVGGAIMTAAILTLVRLWPRLPARSMAPAAAVGVAVLMTGPATWAVTSVQASNSGLLPRAGPAGTANSGGFGGGAPGRFAAGANFGPPGAPPNGAPPAGSAANGPPPATGSNGAAPVAPGTTAKSGKPTPPATTGTTRKPSSTGITFGGLAGSTTARRFGPGGAGGPNGGTVDSALLTFLEKHQGRATYLFGSPSVGTAETYIIATGKPVMAMGGFTGSDPILTTAKLNALVKAGAVRYFLLGGGGPGGDGASTSWITTNCTVVPASAYSSSARSTATRGFGGTSELYDCAGVK